MLRFFEASAKAISKARLMLGDLSFRKKDIVTYKAMQLVGCFRVSGSPELWQDQGIC